ncbi:hypothetical protein BTM_5920 (plasmid) [Burkholderia thailandensis 34]|nr:hypothetical protein BTM_5920 [Burkholderia thailandensis 34]PNE73235.1 recombinase family protein [Burkholderia thailandensis]
MNIGYARVSTDEQHLDLQMDALRHSGCDRIFFDHGISGTRTDRPGLRDALAAIKPGDTLTVWKLDRLGRSLSHLVTTVTELDRSGIRVVSLTEAIDTRSSTGRFTFHIIAALAEFERSLIGERTRAGLVAARARGRRPGRPVLLDVEKLKWAEKLLESQSLFSVAQMLDVHHRTLRRNLKKLRLLREPSNAIYAKQPIDIAINTLRGIHLAEWSVCTRSLIGLENAVSSNLFDSSHQHRRIKYLIPDKKAFVRSTVCSPSKPTFIRLARWSTYHWRNASDIFPSFIDDYIDRVNFAA